MSKTIAIKVNNLLNPAVILPAILGIIVSIMVVAELMVMTG